MVLSTLNCESDLTQLRFFSAHLKKKEKKRKTVLQFVKSTLFSPLKKANKRV